MLGVDDQERHGGSIEDVNPVRTFHRWCALLCPRAATAQGLLHRLEFFAEGGASFSNQLNNVQVVAVSGTPPQEDTAITSASLRTTGRLFGGIRYWFNPHEALEASYSYAPTDVLLKEICTPNCGSLTATGITRTDFFAVNYVRTLHVRGRMRPFLTAGLGAVLTNQVIAQHLTNKAFAANFGGGFDFQVSRHWALRAEYRDWLFEMPQENDSSPTGLTHNSVPSVGFVFRF